MIMYDIELRTSQNLIFLETDNGNLICYSSLFGNARLVSEGAKTVLDFFNKPDTLQHFADEYNLTREDKEIVEDIVSDFIDAHFLLLPNQDERNILEKDNKEYIRNQSESFPFEFIGFNVTDRCNFACRYCVAGANECKKEYLDFDIMDMSDYMQQFASDIVANGKSSMSVGFTGGEPLIRWNELEPILTNVKEKYKDKIEIHYFMNTNASLVNPQIAKDFKRLDVVPSLSIDGVKKNHDKVRVYKGGSGTFDDVIQGIRLLRNEDVTCNGFYLTLTDANFDFDVAELMQFAHDNGFSTITIEPDLVHSLSFGEKRICTKLFECYNAGKAMNIEVIGFWIRPYNNLFSYSENAHGFCRALDYRSIVINKNGYISPCGYSSLKIADFVGFSQLAKDSCYQQFIEQNMRGNIAKCHGCELEGVCKGGCLISRLESEISDNVFEYRCKIYKEMTKLLLTHSDFEECED